MAKSKITPPPLETAARGGAEGSAPPNATPAKPASPPPREPHSGAIPRGSARLVPVQLDLSVPMLRLFLDDDRQPYVQRRVELDLPPEEAQALRLLYDGLRARDVFSRPNPSPADAVKWLLRELSRKFNVKAEA